MENLLRKNSQLQNQKTTIGEAQTRKRIKSNKTAIKFYIKENIKKDTKISSPEVVYNEMKDIALADQESLWVLYVNSKNQILGKDIVSLGGVDSAHVDMKILFRRIIQNNAVSFFIVHNHPSNDVSPSSQDKNLTENVKKASEILQLRFLDHIIVAENSYYSFNKQGLM
jgi:DNA repair protein RadC